MSNQTLTKDFDFQLTTEYTYDTTKIAVSGGAAALKAVSSAYGTSNPTIQAKTTLLCSKINAFTETVTGGSGDITKHIMTVNGQDYWWTGSRWGTSNGAYAQSNLAADVNTNIGSLIASRSRVRLKTFLHSGDGTSTINLSNINLSYDFAGYSVPDDIRGVMVNVENSHIKDEQITTYIENSDNFIDQALSQAYTLPITDADALKILRTFSVTLASYSLVDYLQKREGDTEISSLTKSQYKVVMENLKNIAEGKMNLVGMSNTGKMSASTENYLPTFNQGDFENMHVDENLLTDIGNDAWVG